jgi:hypothetical protein
MHGLCQVVGPLSTHPVGKDVAAMEEVETNGVLVLGNGCWAMMRLDILEPIGQCLTDGCLQGWL